MNKLSVLLLVFLTSPFVVDTTAKKDGNCAESLRKYPCKLKRAVDKQINMELEAFYGYLRMADFFAHESYNLPGLSKFLFDNSQEELKHAQKMMEYQRKRGARTNYYKLRGNKLGLILNHSWSNATVALSEVLALEYSVTKKIEDLHHLAGRRNDIHLQDFLESNFIPEQYDSMKNIADKLKTLQRITRSEPNAALAEFQFDKLVMQEQK